MEELEELQDFFFEGVAMVASTVNSLARRRGVAVGVGVGNLTWLLATTVTSVSLTK